MPDARPRPPPLATQQWRLLVESVAEYAIFMLDPAGHIATWNPGAQRAKGYAADEILGRHFSVFYTPEDRAAGLPERVLDEVRACGRFEGEGWRVRKDGSRFWGHVLVTRVVDDAGRLVGFAKITRDLTDKKEAEEALRCSEERFRLLVNGVIDYALYMLDPEGRVTTWNSGAERMKGYTTEEILGRSFSIFFPPADVAAGKPARELATARDEGHFEEEAFRVRKDGTPFWAHVALTPIRDGTGELVGFAKVTRDLTARRQAEEMHRSLLEEQAARAAAEDANRVKDEFLATVSHELRTPLNAVLGWASLLRDRCTDPSLTKGLDVIHRNAGAQARIIDDILDVSRIMTGKLLLDPAPVRLDRVAEEAIEVIRPAARAKRIAITRSITASHPTVLGDAERLRQVVWNLLSNAVKFTDAGGAVELGVADDGSEVELTVRDTGRGIPPDLLPRVFDRFTQGDSSSTRRVGGLGLGLAIVRHIVELHGGTVRAESDGAGAGATFHVVFPRALAAGGRNVAAASRAPSAAAGLLEGIHVLVVDDDVDARELMEHALAGAGATIRSAPSVTTALASIARERPDLVVSDVAMPEEDGYSFARRLASETLGDLPPVPAVAVTAYTRAEDRRRALEAGFAEHLGKPIRPDELIHLVAKMVGRSAA